MNSALKSFAGAVGHDHVWRQLRAKPSVGKLRPVLFLDRDGVVVEEVNYLHRIADVKFIDGVVETVIAARLSGWRVAMVTNQAGIGRGFYGWDEFALVNQFILDWLDSRCASIDAVLACPHHPEGTGVYGHPDHPMRKPNPGMLLSAAEMLNGDLANSLIVGDTVADIQAGKRAGLLHGFHVLTGHGLRYRSESEALTTSDFAVHVIADLGEDDLRRTLLSAVGNVLEGIE